MKFFRTAIPWANFSGFNKKQCTSTFPWMVPSHSNKAQFIYGDNEKQTFY